MTDINVKEISVFFNLSARFDETVKHAPPALDVIKQALEELKRDIHVNVLETKQELASAKQELMTAQATAALEEKPDYSEIRRLQELISQLTERLHSLENASAHMDGLIFKYHQVQDKFGYVLKDCQPAKQKLMIFENISQKYLALHGGSHHNGGRKSSSKEYKHKIDDADVREVSDTYHYTKENNLTQMDLDNLEGKLNGPGYKGNKISIDRVSQNDFSLLEKNGYEISKVGPNEYSAFKKIEK
jgi:hypothetical protein